jgi:hypothetical protein
MEEIVIQLDCFMCKKVQCEFCGGFGGSPQPVSKEEYNKYFRGCRIIK